MTLHFDKYQGTGNDFIIIDNRQNQLPADKISQSLIKNLCDRRMGIGADGLMLLQDAEDLDFRMRYFNADGGEGPMCGNGGRCIVSFARRHEIIDCQTSFIAADGPHQAQATDSGSSVKLKLQDIAGFQLYDDGYFIDTGAPHFVMFVDNIESLDVENKGRELRHDSRFEKGANINFVQMLSAETMRVRTYERGVEAETYSCGTGVTASAVVAHLKENRNKTAFAIATLGGPLTVSFTPKSNDTFEEVFLQGPATFVYKGEIEI